MVDPAQTRALLARLTDRRQKLERYAERPGEEYLADEEAVLASKYLLVTVIEDALSLANHVIASEGYRSPGDYADAFRVLAEREIIGSDLGRRLEAMARFRNLLVHVYAEVDDGRVHQILRSDLPDIAAFSDSIVRAFTDLG